MKEGLILIDQQRQPKRHKALIHEDVMKRVTYNFKEESPQICFRAKQYYGQLLQLSQKAVSSRAISMHDRLADYNDDLYLKNPMPKEQSNSIQDSQMCKTKTTTFYGIKDRAKLAINHGYQIRNRSKNSQFVETSSNLQARKGSSQIRQPYQNFKTHDFRRDNQPQSNDELHFRSRAATAVLSQTTKKQKFNLNLKVNKQIERVSQLMSPTIPAAVQIRPRFASQSQAETFEKQCAKQLAWDQYKQPKKNIQKNKISGIAKQQQIGQFVRNTKKMEFCHVPISARDKKHFLGYTHSWRGSKRPRNLTRKLFN